MNGYNRMQAEVTDLARDNFNEYSDDYPLDEVFPDFVNQGAKGSYLVASEEALNNAEALAISYYENRSELDVERDDEAGVVVLDYIEAVRCALIDWIQNAGHRTEYHADSPEKAVSGLRRKIERQTEERIARETETWTSEKAVEEFGASARRPV